MMKTITTTKAPAAIGPYSQAKVVNSILYTSGQIPLNPKTGEVAGTEIAEQTEQVMKNIAAILEESGTDFENVIKTTCFLDNMNDFGTFNTIYEKYFIGKPARSCVAVKQLPKGVLVEVEVIAVIL